MTASPLQTILTLPWAPSVNHYWRHVGTKVLISAEGRLYRRRVNHEALVQRAKRFGAAPLEVLIDAYPPDRRKRDLDNLLKGLLDSLTHAGVYGDDSQINELSIKRMRVVKGGKLVVRLVAIDLSGLFDAPTPEVSHAGSIISGEAASRTRRDVRPVGPARPSCRQQPLG